MKNSAGGCAVVPRFSALNTFCFSASARAAPPENAAADTTDLYYVHVGGRWVPTVWHCVLN